MTDIITNEVILGNVKIVKEGNISKVTVNFSNEPSNPIKIVIFSTN